MARKGENIYHRKDGRFEGRYRKGRNSDGRLKYGYVYGETKEETRKKLLTEQEKYPSGLWKKEKRTVRWWMEKWLDERLLEDIEVTSYALYERQIRLHILPALGMRPLNAVGNEEIQSFIEGLKMKQLSNCTINQICALLKRALKQAEAAGYVEKFPMIRRLKEEKKLTGKLLDAGETRLLDKYLTKENDIPVFLGVYLGLRLGEICALQWNDLDLENGQLYVRRSVQCVSVTPGVRKLLNMERDKKTIYLVKSPKTPAGNRSLPLPETIVKTLRVMEERKDYEGNGFVFGTRTQPAKPRTMQKHFYTVGRKHLGKTYGFHALRHTFASRFMEECDNPEMLRSLLGHSSVKLTMSCYVHSDEKGKRKALERIFISRQK